MLGRSVRRAAELGVADLRAVATFLGLEYVGTWLETTGEKSSFQCDATTVPYFPRDVPVRRRVTYWRWTRGSGVVDVLAATLDNTGFSSQNVTFGFRGHPFSPIWT